MLIEKEGDMRTKIALVCALALAMGLMAGTALANNASGDKSTGGVTYMNLQNNEVGVSFNAHETPNNPESQAKGRVNVRDHQFGGTFVSFRGDVDCYNNSGPNTATFSGVITDHDAPMTDPNVGYFRVSVEDNGNPGWRGPDQITVNRAATPFDCEVPHDAVRDVIRGNLKVHH
jgi:hypothetical protein